MVGAIWEETAQAEIEKAALQVIVLVSRPFEISSALKARTHAWHGMTSAPRRPEMLSFCILYFLLPKQSLCFRHRRPLLPCAWIVTCRHLTLYLRIKGCSPYRQNIKVSLRMLQLARSLTFVLQGSGGGPKEDNTTSFLVRSMKVGWVKNCLLAVDAGLGLGAISKILTGTKTDAEEGKKAVSLTEGPFQGLQVENSSPDANAAHITRTLVETYLITHPHLDHIAGFVVNTAALLGNRPKYLAGLPSTIDAFSKHIFNHIIWPNLSTENDGYKLVSYVRLTDGGDAELGVGETTGYRELCDGLLVKAWGVSHGHSMQKNNHRGSNAGTGSRSSSQVEASPRRHASVALSVARTGSRTSLSADDSQGVDSPEKKVPIVYDSSAFFIRDAATGKEILMFGDVEPDSVSESARNKIVWQDAAPKIIAGNLKAIFIECSWTDDQPDDRLYGHLTPKHLIEEMMSLANEVRKFKEGRKRKRDGNGDVSANNRRKSSLTKPDLSPVSPRTSRSRRAFDHENGNHETVREVTIEDARDQGIPIRDLTELPLKGLKIVIIHVKEHLADSRPNGEIILEQLDEHNAEARLGCEFVIAKSGKALYF